MTRQLALGVVIGFAVAVLALALWDRKGAAPDAPDAGSLPKDRPAPVLELRGVPIETLPVARQHVPFRVVLQAQPDGGP